MAFERLYRKRLTNSLEGNPCSFLSRVILFGLILRFRPRLKKCALVLGPWATEPQPGGSFPPMCRPPPPSALPPHRDAASRRNLQANGQWPAQALSRHVVPRAGRLARDRGVHPIARLSRRRFLFRSPYTRKSSSENQRTRNHLPCPHAARPRCRTRSDKPGRHHA